MKSAIDAALGYKKGPNGEALDPLTGKPKTEDTNAGEKKAETPAAGDGKETDTHHANGKPKKDEKGQALDDKGQVVKQAERKVKTAAELELKPEERKALGTKANIRFGELINTVKAHEQARAKDGETIKVLTEARDAILGVMQETGTSQEQLGAYLEFNALLHSQDPKDLEQALSMVEAQRAELYKALGREPKGGDLDLLADFPDLKKQVDEDEITREAALEIAAGRRDKAARNAAAQRQQHQQRSEQQSADQRKKDSEAALAEIDKWTASIAKSDLDYKAKEDKLLAKLDGVLKNYPPNKWLETLKLLYDGIELPKTTVTTGGDTKPLRPTGARPGAKQPATMEEAISQGLGYAKAG